MEAIDEVLRRVLEELNARTGMRVREVTNGALAGAMRNVSNEEKRGAAAEAAAPESREEIVLARMTPRSPGDGPGASTAEAMSDPAPSARPSRVRGATAGRRSPARTEEMLTDRPSPRTCRS